MPVWINNDLSSAVFSGKRTHDFWETIFESGKTPQGQQILTGPMDFIEMIREE